MSYSRLINYKWKIYKFIFYLRKPGKETKGSWKHSAQCWHFWQPQSQHSRRSQGGKKHWRWRSDKQGRHHWPSDDWWSSWFSYLRRHGHDKLHQQHNHSNLGPSTGYQDQHQCGRTAWLWCLYWFNKTTPWLHSCLAASLFSQCSNSFRQVFQIIPFLRSEKIDCWELGLIHIFLSYRLAEMRWIRNHYR